ncbi:hypothetical protein JCM8097_007392 [Rhodosporidiobolus ruineniae]
MFRPAGNSQKRPDVQVLPQRQLLNGKIGPQIDLTQPKSSSSSGQPFSLPSPGGRGPDDRAYPRWNDDKPRQPSYNNGGSSQGASSSLYGAPTRSQGGWNGNGMMVLPSTSSSQEYGPGGNGFNVDPGLSRLPNDFGGGGSRPAAYTGAGSNGNAHKMAAQARMRKEAAQQRQKAAKPSAFYQAPPVVESPRSRAEKERKERYEDPSDPDWILDTARKAGDQEREKDRAWRQLTQQGSTSSSASAPAKKTLTAWDKYQRERERKILGSSVEDSKKATNPFSKDKGKVKDGVNPKKRSSSSSNGGGVLKKHRTDGFASASPTPSPSKRDKDKQRRASSVPQSPIKSLVQMFNEKAGGDEDDEDDAVVVRRKDKGKGKAIEVIDSDDEEEREKAAMKRLREVATDDEDDPLLKQPDTVDPDTLCPFCDDLMPPSPSPALLALKKFLITRPNAEEIPTFRNPKAVRLSAIETASFCKRHNAERVTIPEGKARGWPTEHDWDELARRIERDCVEHLRQLIFGKVDSAFVQLALEAHGEKGKNMRGVAAEFGSFDVEQPGYYGGKGFEVMHKTLHHLFTVDNPILSPSRTPGLPLDVYLRRVLVPECAVSLVLADHADPPPGSALPRLTTREEAEVVVRESRAYGSAMFGGMSEEEALENARHREKVLGEEEKAREKKKRRREQEREEEEEGSESDDEEFGERRVRGRAKKEKGKGRKGEVMDLDASEDEAPPSPPPPPPPPPKPAGRKPKAVREAEKAASSSAPSSSASASTSTKPDKAPPSSSSSSSKLKKSTEPVAPPPKKKKTTAMSIAVDDSSDSDIEVTSQPSKLKKATKSAPLPSTSSSKALKPRPSSSSVASTSTSGPRKSSTKPASKSSSSKSSSSRSSTSKSSSLLSRRHRSPSSSASSRASSPDPILDGPDLSTSFRRDNARKDKKAKERAKEKRKERTARRRAGGGASSESESD